MRADIVEEYEKRRLAVPYPRRPDEPIRSRYENNEKYGVAKDAYDIQMALWREAVKKYRFILDEVDMQFKSALLKHFGIEKHSKAEKLWRLAWQYGRASGYSEVFNCAQEYVELLK